MHRSSKAVVLGFTVLSSLVHVWKIRCSVHKPTFIKPEIRRSLLVTHISYIKQGNLQILILLLVVSMFWNWVLHVLITWDILCLSQYKQHMTRQTSFSFSLCSLCVTVCLRNKCTSCKHRPTKLL